MITGSHIILYSQDAEADRAFFRDVLTFKNIDVGHGCLIFALPPSEAAVHPAEDNRHELYLMTDDLADAMTRLRGHSVACTAVQEARWGSITSFVLPGSGTLNLYQPKHPRP